MMAMLAKIPSQEEIYAVLYRSKMEPGENKGDFELFTLMEFIAAITTVMLPPPTLRHRAP